MEIRKSIEFEQKVVHKKKDVESSIDLLFTPLEKEIRLPGATLEAQYSVEDKYIVFVTNGIVFEETLYITYLDSEGNILDSLELAVMYADGILENFCIELPNKIIFTFFSKNVYWELEILSKPKIQLWAGGLFITRNSPFLHKTYIKLSQRS